MSIVTLKVMERLAHRYHIELTSLGDVPRLVKALEEHHKFATARSVSFSYDVLMMHINLEYRVPNDTNAKTLQEG